MTNTALSSSTAIATASAKAEVIENCSDLSHKYGEMLVKAIDELAETAHFANSYEGIIALCKAGLQVCLQFPNGTMRSVMYIAERNQLYVGYVGDQAFVGFLPNDLDLEHAKLIIK